MTAFSIVNLFATFYQSTCFQITDMKAMVINDWYHIHTYAFLVSFHSYIVLTKISQSQWRLVSQNTSLVKHILVPGTIKSVNVFSNYFSSNARLTGTITGKVSASNSSILHSFMEIIKHSISNRMFESMLQTMSPRQEEPLWERFMMQNENIFWEGNIRVKWSLIIKASPNVVTDFLIYPYRDQKRQVSTIKGYKFILFQKSNIIGTLCVLLELINSFNAKSNVNGSFAPNWDLPYFLTYLCKESFVPLNQASLINLSLKRVFFLLSMAMARCVSEILAFWLPQTQSILIVHLLLELNRFFG